MGIPIVPEKFITDSIEKNQLQDVRDYQYPTLHHYSSEDEAHVDAKNQGQAIMEDNPRKKRKAASGLQELLAGNSLEEEAISTLKGLSTKSATKTRVDNANSYSSESKRQENSSRTMGSIIINNPVDCVFEFGKNK